MKKFTKHITAAMLALLLPASALATDRFIQGFLGHPIIEEDGYIAMPGRFQIELGDAPTYKTDDKLTSIMDEDPNNAVDAISVLGLTVGYNEIVSVVADPNNENAKPLPVGQKVGFAVAPAGDGVEVLDLSVIEVMTINLLDRNGKILKTVAAKNDETVDLINLSLINVNVDNGEKNIYKIVGKIPEIQNQYSYDNFLEGYGNTVDPEGNSLVYGISLSCAGVNASVGHNFLIYYALIDDFDRYEIIKKHYPFATGKVSGLGSGGSLMVDNNIETNGATTAILESWTEFTVMINEYYFRDCEDALGTHKAGDPVVFPKGVEAGWKLTTGQLLNLSVSDSYVLYGIAIDKETKKTTEVKLSTSVSVLGLKLIGGGETYISFKTPMDYDLVGFKLTMAKVLGLNLGVTTVNFAYIKAPTDIMPARVTPFSAKIEAVPGAKTEYNNGTVTNTYQNAIRIANNPENPLKAPSYTASEDMKVVWGSEKSSIGLGLSVVDRGYVVQLGLARRPVYEDGTVGADEGLGRFDILYIGKTNLLGSYDVDWKYFSAGDITWRFKPMGQTTTTSNYMKANCLNVADDGTLDLSPLMLTAYGKNNSPKNSSVLGGDGKYEDSSVSDKIAPNSNNIVGYEYGLYYLSDEQEAMLIDNYSEECMALDLSYVTVPNFIPEFELAGNVDFIDINNKTLTAVNGDVVDPSADPADFVDANTDTDDVFRHYVSWTVPNEVDSKTDVKSVTVYRHSGNDRSELQQYTLEKTTGPDGNAQWTWDFEKSSNPEYVKGFVRMFNDESKVVVLIDDPDDEYNYSLAYSLGLSDEYQKLLETDFNVPAGYYANRMLDYAWHPGNKPTTYNLPTLALNNDIVTTYDSNEKYTVHSSWVTTLPSDTRNDDKVTIGVKAIHNSARYDRAGELLESEQVEADDDIDNVEILYNVWSELSKQTSTYALAPASEDEILSSIMTVKFNDGSNDANHVNDVYATTSYLDDETEGDHLLTTGVTYETGTITSGVTYQATVRAYVPVVPYGFDNIGEGLTNDVQSYLVVETSSDPIMVLSNLSGVENVSEDFENADAEPEYFTPAGVRVENPAPGVYIVRRGNYITKEYIK